jgi:hypothetical protein
MIETNLVIFLFNILAFSLGGILFMLILLILAHILEDDKNRRTK